MNLRLSRMVLVACLSLLNIFMSGLAWAHGGEGHTEEIGWWTRWDSRPLIAVNLLLMSLFYGLGCYRWYRHSRFSSLPLWRIFSFWVSVIALFIALISPVDTFADRLGWMHMIQHMILMMLAAPLLIVSSAGQYMIWALPLNWRRRFSNWPLVATKWRLPYYTFTQPVLIWVLYAMTLWIWHLRHFYQAALNNPVIHDMQHLSFFMMACLFWQALLHPLRNQRINEGVAVLYLFLASIHTIALGVLMALSPFVWYPFYIDTTPSLGFTPLEDQQLAGFIMWMPACMMYAAITVALCVWWIKGLQNESVFKQREVTTYVDV